MADDISVTVDNRDVRRILRAFRDLPKHATNELRDANQAISESLAKRIAGAARASDAQSALIAPTVRAQRDRTPSVVAGGSRRVGSRRTPAYKVLFGSEFGGTYWRQFRPHQGSGSFWFFTTVEDNQDEVLTVWARVAESVAREWGSAG